MAHRAPLEDTVRQVNESFPEAPRMTPRDVKALDVPFLFVDCRSKEEMDVSKIDMGALSIEEFEQQLHDIVDRDVIIICHCTVGIRSARFVSKHQNNVGLRMYTMPGGILSWVDEGYPIYEHEHSSNQGTPSARVTRRMHVCLEEFVRLAPTGYDCLYTTQPKNT